MKVKMRTVPFLTLIALFPILGCGDGVGDRDNNLPSVSGSLSRRELSFSGGTVQISVIVDDPSGVKTVVIDLFPRPSGFDFVTLDPAGKTSITHTLTVSIPANPLPSDLTYQILVTAEDNLGNKGTKVVGEIIVRSPLTGLPSLPNPSAVLGE